MTTYIYIKKKKKSIFIVSNSTWSANKLIMVLLGVEAK